MVRKLSPRQSFLKWRLETGAAVIEMTPNDAQIDVLLRRYSQKAESTSASELAGPMPNIEGHLDADELNAFAEGALSSVARARYVSHLADCDHCRQLATQLTLAAGRSVLAD